VRKPHFEEKAVRGKSFQWLGITLHGKFYKGFICIMVFTIIGEEENSK